MQLIDLIIVLGYLIVSAAIPWFVSGRQKNKEDFLMAGRKMHWLPVTLSGVAAGFSAISLLGTPGFVLAHDLRYLQTLIVGLLSLPIMYFWVAPFIYRLRIVSIYEFLEQRFCPGLRYFASFLFMLSKLGYLAVVIYAPAMTLNVMTGQPIWVFILLFSVVSALYAMMGGLEGVMWCNVMQYAIIVVGITAAVLFFFDGNMSQYLDVAVKAGKTRCFDFSFDFKSLSFWVLLININLLGVARSCSDQGSVQQMCAARSLKDCLWSYVLATVFGMPIVLALYFLGICLFGYVNVTVSPPAEIMTAPDKIFPYVISHHMPTGVSGILLAAILAAGISSVSYVIHAMTSTFMVDVYEKLFKKSSDSPKYVLISRCVTLGWGMLAGGLAFYVMYLGNTIVEATAIVTSMVAAPLGGIFLLGIFTKFTNTVGVFVGGIAGTCVSVATWWMNKHEMIEVNFMWFGVFSIVTTIVVGSLVSKLSAGGNCGSKTKVNS
ncbi:MAG: sodium/solute symporter [Oligosphaeraceae bacterium]|nr:sodium/solute symporter [Oligosphaeraceae bacterium]